MRRWLAAIGGLFRPAANTPGLRLLAEQAWYSKSPFAIQRRGQSKRSQRSWIQQQQPDADAGTAAVETSPGDTCRKVPAQAASPEPPPRQNRSCSSPEDRAGKSPPEQHQQRSPATGKQSNGMQNMLHRRHPLFEGVVVFEVDWPIITGLDYYNPLTSTAERPGRVAFETPALTKRCFDTYSAAVSHYGLEPSPAATERCQLDKLLAFERWRADQGRWRRGSGGSPNGGRTSSCPNSPFSDGGGGGEGVSPTPLWLNRSPASVDGSESGSGSGAQVSAGTPAKQQQQKPGAGQQQLEADTPVGGGGGSSGQGRSVALSPMTREEPLKGGSTDGEAAGGGGGGGGSGGDPAGAVARGVGTGWLEWLGWGRDGSSAAAAAAAGGDEETDGGLYLAGGSASMDSLSSAAEWGGGGGGGGGGAEILRPTEVLHPHMLVIWFVCPHVPPALGKELLYPENARCVACLSVCLSVCLSGTLCNLGHQLSLCLAS
eukprot:SAG22_NODE_1634_length_3927_cov_1.953239_2_plen_487_part_00